MAKSNTISIFLLKDGVSFQEALRDPDDMHGATQLADLGVANGLVGSRLYIADYASKAPWWKEYLSVDRNIKQESKGAILFLSAGGRNFAITFGHVAHYLKDWRYEYDFGLLATLNAVRPEALKSADVLRPENARRQRIQSAKGGGLGVFGIDFDESVIKKLSGEVKDEWQGVFSMVTGANNVRITTKVEMLELPELCEALLELYRKEDFKQAFPDLRNVIPVSDPERLASLDEKLIEAFRHKESSITLSIPDIVDYQVVSGMKVSNGCVYPLFIIESVWDHYGEGVGNVTVDALKNHHISLVDENGHTVGGAHSIYKCLIWDCDEDSGTYHFCDGAWYKIDAAFAERIKTDLDAMFVETDLPANDGNVEGQYNQKVAAEHSEYLCLDRTNIAHRPKNIEPCDLFRVVSGKAEMVHVKIGIHSSKLSHLFNQGLVSFEMLQQEEESRARLKQIIIEKAAGRNIQTYCEPVDKRQLKIVYAIITKKDPRLKSKALPLFSRISLRSLASRLKKMGAEIEVKLVPDNVDL